MANIKMNSSFEAGIRSYRFNGKVCERATGIEQRRKGGLERCTEILCRRDPDGREISRGRREKESRRVAGRREETG